MTKHLVRRYILASLFLLLTAVAGKTTAQSVPIPPTQPSPDGGGGNPNPNCIPGMPC